MLCTNCDEVFHKAVLKRCHIRLPVSNTEKSLFRSIFKYLPEFQKLLVYEELENECENKGCESSYLFCLALLTASSMEMIDEIRVRYFRMF